MTHIDNNEEGRPTFRDGQCLGVALRLPARCQHGLIPAMRSADGRPFLHPVGFFCRSEADRGICQWVAALLGFQHETAAFVQVDVVRRRGAVQVLQEDSFVDHILVGALVGLARLWAGHVQVVAEFGQKQRVVRALRRRGLLPTSDKVSSIQWQGIFPFIIR